MRCAQGRLLQSGNVFIVHIESSSRLEAELENSSRLEAELENYSRLEAELKNYSRLEVEKERHHRMEEENKNSHRMESKQRTHKKEDNQHPLCTVKEKLHKKAFVDDLTLLERISLKDLEMKERIIGPLNYHDRHNLTMPPHKSILQHQLQDLKTFTTQHHMLLNSKKTKCIPFNSSKSKDFMPELQLEDGSLLEVIYQLRASWFSGN